MNAQMSDPKEMAFFTLTELPGWISGALMTELFIWSSGSLEDPGMLR